MTIEEKIRALLDEHGAGGYADKLIELAKSDKSLAEMSKRWADDINEYPQIILIQTWINVKEITLKWIDENLPKAFFRPLFTE